MVAPLVIRMANEFRVQQTDFFKKTRRVKQQNKLNFKLKIFSTDNKRV